MARIQRHPLEDIMTRVISAVMGGADGWMSRTPRPGTIKVGLPGVSGVWSDKEILEPATMALPASVRWKVHGSRRDLNNVQGKV